MRAEKDQFYAPSYSLRESVGTASESEWTDLQDEFEAGVASSGAQGRQGQQGQAKQERAADGTSPLLIQAGMLVAAAGVSGVLVGMVVGFEWAKPGWLSGWIPAMSTWALLVVWAIGMLFLGVMAGRSMAQPYEKLADSLSRLALSRSRLDVKKLPTKQTNELGRMSRAFVDLASAAERDAKRVFLMRRTLDDRIEKAKTKALGQLLLQVNRDALTRLGNRRFLDQELDNLVNLSLASHTPLLAIAIDLDHFKQVNDSLGHDAGDDLLKLVSELMRQSIRRDDLAFRLGGDEFLVLMPGGSMQRAFEYTEQLRTQFVQQSKIRFRSSRCQPNLSIGVASLDARSHADGKALLKAADNALYEAKKRGRGCTAGVTDCLLSERPMRRSA